jgi:membrane protease YdiL (CAAX protease family)
MGPKKIEKTLLKKKGRCKLGIGLNRRKSNMNTTSFLSPGLKRIRFLFSISFLTVLLLTLPSFSGFSQVNDNGLKKTNVRNDYEKNNLSLLLNSSADFLEKGDYQRAISSLEQAYQLAPNDNDVRKGLVIAYQSYGTEQAIRKEWDRAILLFKKAIELEPSAMTWNALKECYHQKRDYLHEWRTSVTIRNWIKSSGGLPSVFYDRGRAYDVKNEIDHYTEEIESEPTLKNLFWLGWIYIKGGNFDKAIETLLAAKAASKNEDVRAAKADILQWLAISYYAIGNIDLAIEAAEQTNKLPFTLSRIITKTLPHALINIAIFLIFLLGAIYLCRFFNDRKTEIIDQQNFSPISSILSFFMILSIFIVITSFLSLLVPKKMILDMNVLQSIPGHVALPHVNGLPFLYASIFLNLVVLVSLFLSKNSYVWFRETFKPEAIRRKETWKLVFLGVAFSFIALYLYNIGWAALIGGEPKPHFVTDLLGKDKRLVTLVVSLLAGAILVPFMEELLFRGFLQTILQKITAPKYALICTAIFFAASHYSFSNVAIYFIIGLVLGWLRLKSGNIVPSVICHAIINLTGIITAAYFPNL